MKNILAAIILLELLGQVQSILIPSLHNNLTHVSKQPYLLSRTNGKLSAGSCSKCACSKSASSYPALYDPPSVTQDSSCSPCSTAAEVSENTFNQVYHHLGNCFIRPNTLSDDIWSQCWGADHQGKVAWIIGDCKAAQVKVMVDAKFGVESNFIAIHDSSTELLEDVAIKKATSLLKEKGKAGDILFFAWWGGHPHAAKMPLLASKLMAVAREKQIKFVVIKDSPTLSDASVNCVHELPRSTKCRVSRSTGLESRYHVQLDGAVYFDFGSLLCDKEWCDIVIPGTQTVYVMDNMHLNREGANYLAPFLCSAFA
jgi:phage gp46-like protein